MLFIYMTNNSWLNIYFMYAINLKRSGNNAKVKLISFPILICLNNFFFPNCKFFVTKEKMIIYYIIIFII